MMRSGFRWTTFDVTSRLCGGWQQEIAAAAADAEFREFPRTPVLSRESQDVQHIFRGRVHASDVRRNLPWLYRLYRERFLELAQKACAEPVRAARDDRYGIVLNVQRGAEMRFECHVDSNPLTGLLFCTGHLTGAGGELVFAHDPAAADINAVERDCSVIRPHAGHLIFFDGRAPALRSFAAVRVRRAYRRRHELLHRVVPGVDPAPGAQPSPLRPGVSRAARPERGSGPTCR